MSYDAVAASGSRYRVGDVQYDEKGKAFVNMSDGSRVYLSPYATNPYATPEQAGKPEGGGLLHGGAEWNTETGEWDVPFDWSKLLNYGVGAGIGMGGASAAGAFGGSGAAASSMPALSSPASVLPSGGGGMLGAGGASAGTGMGAAAGGAAGKSVLERLLGAGIPLGMAAAGRVMGGGGQDPPPELQELLNLQKNRMMQQNPLFEAVTRLAMSRLPTNMQMPIPGQGER